jgi:8-oxo-dGTP pyrophosphatase MutT (NUDIX family)
MAQPDAAVALVHAQGAADSVLLMLRAERAADPWSGHWSFPGGRYEPEDSDLLFTALRELDEECGIRLDRDRLEAALPLAVARRRVGRFLLVAPFVLRVDAEHLPTPNPKEAKEAVWAPLSLLRDPSRHSLRPVPGQPPEVRFPCIDLNGVPLWGFTYRLIADWLQLVPPTPGVEAGFQVANELLEFLIEQGCAIEHAWETRDGVKLASVSGRIPVDAVWERMAMPAKQIPRVNMLEVRPTRLRMVGLALEEYVIKASIPTAAPPVPATATRRA